MQLRYLASRTPKKDVLQADADISRESKSSSERRFEPESSLPSQPPLAPLPRPIRAPTPLIEVSGDDPDDTEPARSSSPTITPDPRRILDSIGEVVYDWDLRNDRINWGPNVAEVLGVANAGTIATGRAFAECLSPDSESSRYQAIARSTATDGGRTGGTV